MSCPFYAHALFVPILGTQWTFVPNPDSNQCALITHAHSPCVMEVYEEKPADFATCRRNPENMLDMTDHAASDGKTMLYMQLSQPAGNVINDFAAKERIAPAVVLRQALAMYQLVREGEATLTVKDKPGGGAGGES